MASRVPAELYEPRPLRVAADLLRSWGLIAAAIGTALALPSFVTWACAVVVIGSQQYALHILLHDGHHGTLFGSQGTTRRWSRPLGAAIFNAYGPYRKKHLAHHRHLGTPRDPDRYYHVSADKATRARLLLFLTGVGSLLTSVMGGRAQEETRGSVDGESTSGRSPDSPDWLLLVAAQGAIAVVLTTLGGWLTYPLLWLLPFLVGVYVTQNFRSFAEHAFPEPDSAADLHRLVTFRSHLLERIVLAPNNMNYHAEHHLHPQVPYYHLPALRRHLSSTGQLQEVEERDGYLSFLLRYWKSLPLSPPN
jgi:fatty acid desaturase